MLNTKIYLNFTTLLIIKLIQMANNVVSLNVYQINQRTPIPLTNVGAIGLPTVGSTIWDVSGSPSRSLSTGVNVYSMVQTVSGDKYYCRETYAALLALWNA